MCRLGGELLEILDPHLLDLSYHTQFWIRLLCCSHGFLDEPPGWASVKVLRTFYVDLGNIVF